VKVSNPETGYAVDYNPERMYCNENENLKVVGLLTSEFVSMVYSPGHPDDMLIVGK
jgi:hypothetical protein